MFESTSLMLYQPEDVLVARLSNIDDLAHYIRRLALAADTYFQSQPPGPGRSGALVVAVKPQHKARFWVELGDGALTPDVERQLFAALLAVPVLSVNGGPVAIAMNFRLWGGATSLPDAVTGPPMPSEWHRAARSLSRPGVVPDDILAAIWPD